MTSHIACPVCGDSATYFDVVDFNKSCGDAFCRKTGLSGIPIYYSKCRGCGFLFAPSIHAWNQSQFLENIYNTDYVKFDGDYLEKRPADNTALVEQLFGHQMNIIRHLDYGGGNGLLTSMLKNKGWDSVSYDPFPSNKVNLETLGRFNLITAFEVFEHVPDVHQLMENISNLLLPNGVVLASTLLSDEHVNSDSRLGWWYAAPRNGHISLFSKASLAVLAKAHGLTVQHLNTNLHIFRNDHAAEHI